MRPRTCICPLLVAVLLTLAGCSVLAPPPNDPTAETIAERAAATTQDVDSYSYRGTVGVVATVDGREETASGPVNGSVNASRREAVTVTRLDGNTRRSYVLADLAIAPCQSAGHAGGNTVYETRALLTGERWRNNTVLASITDPRLAARYTFVENTTFDGDPSSVVVVHPDLEKLEERNRALFGAGAADFSQTENVTARLTVDRESFRVERVTYREVVSESGETATFTITLTFTYGPVEPVDVPEDLNYASGSYWCNH